MEVHVVEHLEKVKLEDIFKKEVKNVEVGTELFFFHEVNKYLEEHGLTLDLSKVKISKELNKSNVMALFYTRYPDLRPDGLKLHNFNYKLLFPIDKTVEGVNLKELAPNHYEYDYYYDYESNKILHTNTASTGYVSMFAYLVVQAYINNTEVPIIRFSTKDNNTHEANNDIILLTYFGNKFADGKVELNIHGELKSKSDLANEMWEAYYHMWYQNGYYPTTSTDPDTENGILTGYSTVVKYQHLQKHYKVGDVVFLYERKKTTKNNFKTKITRCFIAVIRSITEKHVILERLFSDETWASQYINCETLEERDALDGNSTVTPDDYNRNVMHTETYDLTEIGMDMYLRYEMLFIKPVNGFDEGELKLYYPNEHNQLTVRRVKMDSLNYVYTLLEERGLKYDKQRFLAKHFKDTEPIYEKYREHQIKPKDL